jgi:hypothetical protein
MRAEFIVDRQGKTFVLYSGLLDAAHTAGLIAIRTNLIQVPNPENGNTAIVSAEVSMFNGRASDSAPTVKIFCGIGDASPANVPKQILPHIIRMAETRAKARALRDAINVGMSAVEELDDADDGLPAQAPTAPKAGPTPIRQPPTTSKPANGTTTAPPKGPAPATRPPPANVADPQVAAPTPQAPAPAPQAPVGVISELLVERFAQLVAKAQKLAVVPPREMAGTDADVAEQIALLAKAINARLHEIADPPKLGQATVKLAESLATPGAGTAAKPATSVADLYEPATPPAPTREPLASPAQLRTIAEYGKRKGLGERELDNEVFFFSGKYHAEEMTAREAAKFIAELPRPTTPATAGR